MKTKTFGLAALTAASLAALIGGAALAQQAATPRPTPHHARGDVDGDGRITQAEFVQGRVARLSALDADHDGSVSLQEMQAGRQAQRSARASARFERLDADKNGQVSRAEFDAARDGRGPEARGFGGRGQRMGGHGHGGRHGPGQRMAERGPVVIAEMQARLSADFTRLDTDHDAS